jgi:hypothetical protein
MKLFKLIAFITIKKMLSKCFIKLNYKALYDLMV